MILPMTAIRYWNRVQLGYHKRRDYRYIFLYIAHLLYKCEHI